MRIVFGNTPKKATTACGGGNVLLSMLRDHLVKKGHDVVFHLDDKCDVAFVSDPRTAKHLYESGLPVVQRVGDVGTHGKPQLTTLLRQTLPYAAAIIYPSEWAKSQLSVYADIPTFVIPNVADSSVFNKKFKVVTHHWSDNPMKGKEIYEKLQRDQESLNIEFTFIGRPCFDVKEPTRYIPPMSKEQLVEELPKHDFYVTASKLEAGANHVLEAMACGLPVFYHAEGGSIPEYVGKRGVAYEDYSELYSILSPMKSLDEVCEEYCSVLEKVYESPNRNR